MLRKIKSTSIVVLVISFLPLSSLLLSGVAFAAASSATTNTSTTSSNTVAASRMSIVKTAADNEIQRRLTQLGELGTKINSTTKLTSADKTTLETEVNNEVSGLTALKTKIDADTDGPTLHADVMTIFTEYRVYVLVLPKVWIIFAADYQQQVEAKLTALATKLQTRISAAQSQGKSVTTLQTALADMQAKISASQSISSTVETKVLPLQPSDYNSDHTILSGYMAQLKTAHQDNQTAYTDAQTIVSGLKTLQ